MPESLGNGSADNASERIAAMTASEAMIRVGSGTENPSALFFFLVWGVGSVILCCLGYTGNLLSLVALQRDTRSPATTLLQSLAASDLVQLTVVCLGKSVPRICDYTEVCPNIWRIWPPVRYLWLLVPIAHMCSIWIAVLIAANRYWAVCRPYRAATVWSNRRTWVYVGCVVFAVTVFNVPRFFEYRIANGYAKNGTKTVEPSTAHVTVQTYNNNNDNNNNNNNNTTGDDYDNDCRISDHDVIMDFENIEGERTRTEFGKRYSYYYVYKVLLVNAVLILLPLGVLMASSVWIVRSLRIAASTNTLLHSNRKKDATAMTSTGSGGDADRKSSSASSGPSREATFILMTVVVVAVVCQTPLAVFHFVRYRCGQVVVYLEHASKFLVDLNACVNFVVYCVLGRKFRRLLVQALTCGSPRSSTGSGRR